MTMASVGIAIPPSQSAVVGTATQQTCGQPRYPQEMLG
jgi:hypothetical protein